MILSIAEVRLHLAEPITCVPRAFGLSRGRTPKGELMSFGEGQDLQAQVEAL